MQVQGAAQAAAAEAKVKVLEFDGGVHVRVYTGDACVLLQGGLTIPKVPQLVVADIPQGPDVTGIKLYDEEWTSAKVKALLQGLKVTCSDGFTLLLFVSEAQLKSFVFPILVDEGMTFTYVAMLSDCTSPVYHTGTFSQA